MYGVGFVDVDLVNVTFASFGFGRAGVWFPMELNLMPGKYLFIGRCIGVVRVPMFEDFFICLFAFVEIVSNFQFACFLPN